MKTAPYKNIYTYSMGCVVEEEVEKLVLVNSLRMRKVLSWIGMRKMLEGNEMAIRIGEEGSVGSGSLSTYSNDHDFDD